MLRVLATVVKGIAIPEMLKINLAFETGCEEMELIKMLLSKRVKVRTPYPATDTVVATAVNPNTWGKLMVSVSDWNSGVERVRSKARVAVVCTTPWEMEMLVKVFGCMLAIVMLQESMAPIVPVLVCV